MARTRTGALLIDDAYERSDTVGQTARHPRANVLRYVNQGCTELYDLLIEARGRSYYRATPSSITTTASTSRYALPASFYRLISVRLDGANGYTLEAFDSQMEPALRAPQASTTYASHYEIQPGYIELLPLHTAGQTIVVDYVPVFTDLTDGSNTFDGINGWEEYVVNFAAHCIATMDDERELAQALERDNAKLAARIAKLAPGRDAFRAEHVKNVRNRYPLSGWPMPGMRWRL